MALRHSGHRSYQWLDNWHPWHDYGFPFADTLSTGKVTDSITISNHNALTAEMKIL
jgi:hypothetical protein